MADPRRLRIIKAIKTRVAAIALADGFSTDAGQLVIVGGGRELGPDDPAEAIALVVGEEIPGYQGEHVFIRLPIHVCALAKANLDEPWLAVEAVIGDIKRAMELADRTLGGLVRRQIERGPVRTLEREPGSTTVGASVTYHAPYLEMWGDP